ncbi:C39 family peptidase [Clostridium boliviensis]|uniref:C39 family peptidase n=1 Tax=Clostridium boliviensis TaxID=318465 RepID=A0ABU4GH84_9CLOT|nr:C39 family peptidase [Clostridium boliviensis]MDW2796936.1 C39 family peptidase [Clostridium boliviensis]
MKKLAVMFLTVTMVLSAYSSSFAGQGNSGKEFMEAKTVSVTGETMPLSQDTMKAPKGARLARPQDKSGVKEPDMLSESLLRQSASSWKYLNGYTVYSQVTSYNCGPASVQAALNYLGVNQNQSDIARGCRTTVNGSYIADMVTYINRQQGRNRYVGKYNESKSEMTRLLYSSVSTGKAVPIIGLTFSTNDGWLYSTNGHFMSVYGAKGDKSAFALGDPWIGYSGSGLYGESWTYTKSASTLYKAYNKVNIGFMY